MQSRPRWLAVVVHYGNGGYSILSDVKSVTCSTTEDGSEGNFTLVAALDQSTPEGLTTAQTAGPMDLVAIYADRSTIDFAVPTPAFPLGPASTHGLAYPSPSDQSASVTRLLATAALVFVGLADRPQEQKSVGSPMSTLTYSGRSLTKIFTMTNSLVPFSVAQDVAVAEQRISQTPSFGSLMLSLLDFCVAKGLGSAGTTGGATTATLTPSAPTGNAARFGFPWRAFVDVQTSYDPGYQSFKANNIAFPIYNIQDGPAWANAQQIANYPFSRFFINECGQLVFDDAFNAWAFGPVATTIKPEQIIGDVSFTQDDSTVLTQIAVLPMGALASQGNVAAGIAVGAGWSQPPAAIQRYGYRYQQFQSLFDTSADQAHARANVLSWAHNNIWTADLTVMGQAYYRVGQRTYLAYGGANAATQNKLWYISSVQHAMNWEQGYWTTTLRLVYPTNLNGTALDGSAITHPISPAPALKVYAPIRPYTFVSPPPS